MAVRITCDTCEEAVEEVYVEISIGTKADAILIVRDTHVSCVREMASDVLKEFGSQYTYLEMKVVTRRRRSA